MKRAEPLGKEKMPQKGRHDFFPASVSIESTTFSLILENILLVFHFCLGPDALFG